LLKYLRAHCTKPKPSWFRTVNEERHAPRRP
jgi:hypothetical protein